jgi:hypothetical protein
MMADDLTPEQREAETDALQRELDELRRTSREVAERLAKLEQAPALLAEFEAAYTAEGSSLREQAGRLRQIARTLENTLHPARVPFLEC